MNKTFFIGNLTKDPEFTETASGTKICRFSIAVNEIFGDRKTDFIPCVAWRGLAENVAKHVKKGNKVAVAGKLRTRAYEDTQGLKRSAFEIVASDIEFLSPRSSEETEAINNQLQPFDDDSDIPF